MELMSLMFNLTVERIRGQNEYEIYKNYIKDVPRERIEYCLYMHIDGVLITKDDFKAAEARELGNVPYLFKDYRNSLKLYTKSLRYAIYNGEDYALALANRSAVYFSLQDYQSCIEDINLCLKANYPDHLQPKVYIRKARCFQRLGDSRKMRTTLLDALSVIDGLPSKFNMTIKQYKETIKDLITAEISPKPASQDNFQVLPVLEPNPMFLNASSSIMLKYNKQKGCHVVAKKDISIGDVLFVEKAYAFTSKRVDSETDADQHCQYCLLTLKSCVPCKTCVKHLYCTENCRDSAWKEFHQWECLAVQAGLSTCCGDLGFRVILKTAHRGFSTPPINFQEGVNKYGDKDDNYPYVYNLQSNLGKRNERQLKLYAASAALLVNYLKLKTNFFQTMKQIPEYARKSENQLMTIIGGLIIRHSAQVKCHIPVWDYDNDVTTPKELSIGNAICTSLTMMKHSCIANTAHYFVGDTAVVKAIKNIKADEELSYSYFGIPFTAITKDQRQSLFKNNFFLKCECQLCTDPRMYAYDSFLCVKCKGPAIPTSRYSSQFVCLDCNYKYAVPKDVIVKKIVIEEFIARFTLFRDIDDMDRAVHLGKTIYRPYHSTLELLYTNRKDYYIMKGDIKGFLENAMLLLKGLEEKGNGPAVKVGRDSYTYCVVALDILQRVAPNMKLEQFKEVLKLITELLEKAKFIFNLYHGPFLARLPALQKRIDEFQKIYTVPIAYKK